ncbi:MAG: hypothetical protein V7642_4959 [Burkholderiales bacterium]
MPGGLPSPHPVIDNDSRVTGKGLNDGRSMKPLNNLFGISQPGAAYDTPGPKPPKPRPAQSVFDSPGRKKYDSRAGASRFANYFQGKLDLAKAPSDGEASLRPRHVRWNLILDKVPANRIHGGSYKPIVVRKYPNYGTQDQAAVTGTDYAKQLAERLIGDNHKVDLAQIPHILDELKTDQTLSDDHRSQVVQKLHELQSDPELVADINSICEHPGKALRGPAADLVRATLNPPARQTTLGEGHARKAAVMAMFGNLRQGSYVGSCFATSLAICVHEDSSKTVIRNAKALLEENSMRMKTDSGEVQVPLNKWISSASAEVELHVQADGSCYGKASGSRGARFKLHQTPGMQGALTALGIEERQMESAVANALRQIGLGGNRTYPINCKQIIEYLAHNPATGSFVGTATPEQRVVTALNAFAGKEDVRLLRAWEYTLATHSESGNNSQTIRKIASTALYGRPIQGPPELQPLSARNLAYLKSLKSDGQFRGADLVSLNGELFDEVEKIMHARLYMDYDAGIRHKKTSADGSSTRGGFAMYERDPPDDPAKWRRIETAEGFQEAMASAVEQAVSATCGRTRHGCESSALRALAENLKDNIGTTEFIEHLTRRFNDPNGSKPVSDRYNKPWHQARGGFGGATMEHYGSHAIHEAELSPTTSRQNGRDTLCGTAKHGGDATDVMKFICEGMAKMAPALHEKARASRRSIAGGPSTQRGFKVPVMNNVHAFTIMPMEMEDAWASPGTTPEGWVETALRQPARRHVDDTRTRPPLMSVLQSVWSEIGATNQQRNRMYQQISQGWHPGSLEPYSLRRIYQQVQAFAKSTVDPDQTLAKAEAALMKAAPIPARIFADGNGADSKGNCIRVGAVYNPFRKKVELNYMDKQQGNRRPVNDNWIGGHWLLATPMAAAA